MSRGRGERRRVARVVVLFALGGCAQVLGLPADEDLASIAKAFCLCEGLADAWPGETCEAHVEGRLAAADPGVRRAWLDLFTQEQCELCDNEAGRAICAGSAPLCVNSAGACGTTQVCCLADGESVYCGAQGICVEEPAECLEAGVECGGDVPCCGATGQFAQCLPAGTSQRCVEACDPSDAGNCACCKRTATMDGMTLNPAGSSCLPQESVAPDTCDDFCNLAGTGECSPGRTCTPVRVTDTVMMVDLVIDTCLDRCQPLLGEGPGSPCSVSLFGGSTGCCARIVGVDGDADLLCMPTPEACESTFCDASVADPSCASCATVGLFGGESLAMTVDRCQ